MKTCTFLNFWVQSHRGEWGRGIGPASIMESLRFSDEALKKALQSREGATVSPACFPER